MITLVKEREAVGMSSPWRRTPKHAGSRTPGYNTPGNTTPRRSSPSWFDTELASYLTPRRSTASGYDSDFGPFSTTPRQGSATPRRPPEFIGQSEDRDEDYFYTYGTPRRREAMEVVEIGTPKRVTMMGREIDMGGFRSPQPPSDVKNNWGGASPMISRNVPKESMETSYVRFNPLSDMDDDDEERSVRFMKKMTVPPVVAAPPPPARSERKSRRRWWLSKLKWWKRGGRK